LREDDIKEDMDLAVSLGDSKQPCLCLKKGAKTLGREALKTGLSTAGDVVQGRNIKQAAKSRLKSTGQNLLQEAMDMVGSPGQRAIKELAKQKKTRRRQTKQRNTSNDIFG
jgi:hypothetical protein